MEKSDILAATHAGTKQIEIARKFNCCVDTIRSVQREFGFARWRELTPEVERECVALLRLGHGQYRVAKMTRVPQKKIHELMLKYYIVHPVGGLPLPAPTRARITERVRERDAYGIRIAEKENVSKEPVLRIAHQIYGPGRFRGGRVPPFTFVINPDGNIEANCRKFVDDVFRGTFSTEAQAMELTRIFTKLVERYAQLWYDGNIPADRNAFIEELVSAYLPPNLRGRTPFTPEEWRKQRQFVADHVRTAVDSLAGTESVWKN